MWDFKPEWFQSSERLTSSYARNHCQLHIVSVNVFNSTVVRHINVCLYSTWMCSGYSKVKHITYGASPYRRGVLSQVWPSGDSGWWCVTRAEHSITAYNSCSSSPSVCVCVSACTQWGGAAGMTLPSSSCALHGARFSDTWLPIGCYCKGSAEGKQIRGRLIRGCDMSEAKHVTPLIKHVFHDWDFTQTHAILLRRDRSTAAIIQLPPDSRYGNFQIKYATWIWLYGHQKRRIRKKWSQPELC